MSAANQREPLHPALEGAGLGAILTVAVFPVFVIVVFLTLGRSEGASPQDAVGAVAACFASFLLPILVLSGAIAGTVVVIGRGHTIARIIASLCGMLLPATVYYLIILRLADSDYDAFSGMCAFMIEYFLVVALPTVAIATSIRAVVRRSSAKA